MDRPTSRIQAALFASLLALVTACGGDDDNGNGEKPAPEATFATYNAGLARGFIDYATARTEPVAEAVADIEADAVCLQEIWLAQNQESEWTQEPIDTVVDASSASFPHEYVEITGPPEEDEEPACGEMEADPLRQCVEANCADVAPDQLSTCALDNCTTQFNQTSSTCQTCLASNLGGTLDQILFTCRTGSASLTSNGHNGLLLLSEHPYETTESRSFDSTVVQRSALHAVIDHPDIGRTDLYCTHLASNLTEIPYPGDQYESFVAEQAAQVEAVLDWIEETAATDQVVLMGDMNNGPAVGDLTATLPDNYQTFVDAGLRNPYLEAESPACTICEDNDLGDSEIETAIDHVFFDFGGQTDGLSFPTSERILDETQAIETSEGTKQLPLSDHYGVRTTVQLP